MTEVSNESIRQLRDAIIGTAPKSTQPTYARATVTAAGSGGTWVRIEGADGVTPVSSSVASVQPGDTVTVRIGNGECAITGNTTDAAVGQRVTRPIKQAAVEAVDKATAANESAAIAEAAAQTAHSAAQDAVADAAAAQASAHSASMSAVRAQAALDTIGDWDWDAEDFDPNGSYFYKDSLGAHVMSGGETDRNVLIDSGGMHVFSSGMEEGVNEIAHLGYGMTQGEDGADTKPYYSLGKRGTGDIGSYSFVVGMSNSATANCSFAEGTGNKAVGKMSHAEGFFTRAMGTATHAEGLRTEAAEDYVDDVGIYMSCAHAEGADTRALGRSSHAEGNHSEASGIASHAQNYKTVAGSDYQTAIGKYNDNKSTNAFEIGNGDSTARSNAFECDWDGNVTVTGTVNAAAYNIGGNPLLITDTCTSPTTSISGAGTLQATIPTHDGYTPIAIAGFNNTANTLAVLRAYINGYTAVLAVRNTASSATSGTATFTILYAADGVL